MLPGFGYGGYVRLADIISKSPYVFKKIIFDCKKDSVFVNGKMIQGLRITDGTAVITGTHYTSWERATQIRSMQMIEPSLSDPFVYIAETGRMTDWPEEAIKKELGAASANTEVRLRLYAPVENVWIKASREVVHFAIAGIIHPKQIITLTIRKRDI